VIEGSRRRDGGMGVQGAENLNQQVAVVVAVFRRWTLSPSLIPAADPAFYRRQPRAFDPTGSRSIVGAAFNNI
jgi:hypothetical protein